MNRMFSTLSRLVILLHLHAAAASESCNQSTENAPQCGSVEHQTSEQQAFMQLKLAKVGKRQNATQASSPASELREEGLHADLRAERELQSERDAQFAERDADEETDDILGTFEPHEMSSLQSSSLLQQFNVRLSDDGRRASVSFVSAGEASEYHMEVVSAYTDYANISVWTGSGYEYMDLGTPRTFRSGHEGRYARARINEDGSVSGLFEQQDGRVIDVQPLKPTSKEAHALLELYEGEGQAHIFSVTPPLDLGTNPYEFRLSQFMGQARGESEDAANGEPDGGVSGDPDDGRETTDEEEKDFMPKACKGCSPQKPAAFNAGHPWGGVKWYPGCYKGDQELNTMDIQFAIPPNVFRGGDKQDWPTPAHAKPRWEEIITKASFIYEKQMNIQLKLGDVKVATQGGPKWALVGCSRNIAKQLNWALDTYKECDMTPKLAASHIFTNCKTQAVAGLGFLGTLCNKDINKGSDLWQSGNSWFIFAHELGHNFGGKHSFEEGQGKTGGVMDYGDGKINGHYQFNTRYRKPEMCKHLRSIEGCPSFRSASATPPPPVAQRPACQWQKHERMFSGGYADGISDSFPLEKAKAKCVEMGKYKCKAVVCGHRRTTGCTLRATEDLKPYSGEDSYTTNNYICNPYGNGVPAPPPTPAPPGSGGGSGGGGSAPAPSPGSGGGSGSRRRGSGAPPPPPSSGGGSGAPPSPKPPAGSTSSLEERVKNLETILKDIAKAIKKGMEKFDTDGSIESALAQIGIKSSASDASIHYRLKKLEMLRQSMESKSPGVAVAHDISKTAAGEGAVEERVKNLEIWADRTLGQF